MFYINFKIDDNAPLLRRLQTNNNTILVILCLTIIIHSRDRGHNKISQIINHTMYTVDIIIQHALPNIVTGVL